MARATDRPALVLGGSGFLGVQLVRALLEAGAAPVVASSFHGAPPASAGVERARWERVDATDRAALARMLERLQPRTVFCAAALSSAAECERRPADARASNAELPEHLGRWCRTAAVRLVHVSTDLVFGARAAPAGGFREDDEPGPLGAYGATKLAGERALLASFPAALVVRLPLLFGDSFGRGQGASDALLAAVARGERPELFIDEWRTPLAVEDAAAALVELAQGSASGLLHVAGPERTTRFALGIAILRASGWSADEARELVRPAARASYSGPPRAEDVSLDAGRARALIATVLRAPELALAGRRLP